MFRLAGLDVCLCCGNQAVLLQEARFGFGLFCLARGQIGPSVAQRDLEVSWVQAYQRISSGNELVILDQHLGHLSAELATDPSDLSVDVCVIGMLVMPPDKPPMGKECGAGQYH